MYSAEPWLYEFQWNYYSPQLVFTFCGRSEKKEEEVEDEWQKKRKLHACMRTTYTTCI